MIEKQTWWYKKETSNYIVWRCPIYVPKHPNGIKRILHSLSFSISSIPILFRNILWKPNAVIVIEPPFFTAPLTIIYSFFNQAKSILHIQDLEIDAAIGLKIIKDGYFYRLALKIEKFILNRFDIITTISSKMKDKIKEKGINEDKINLFPNWANIESINPEIDNKYLVDQLIGQKYDNLILYSGNIGEKQNLDIVINVAEIFHKKNSNYIFLIVGDGAAKHRLESITKEKKLNNVLFRPLVPVKDLGALLTMADIHLITQDKNITDLVLPSKLTNILSAGGVSIISAKSGTQLAQIIEKYNIGFLINPNSVEELYSAICKIFNNQLLIKKIQKNARDYAIEYLSKNSILKKFENDVLLN
jgi:colanic acid biosynthesis glycosyl transferase WcaI